MGPRRRSRELSNWISVGSLNSNSISRDDSGKLVLKSSAVSVFSNLAQGAELFTVYAPGSNIYSLAAATNGYMLNSGTSMAAPVVSGALALAAQAYPWMSGKQLADTVLTTANNEFEAPDYIVSYVREPEQEVHIISIDNALPDSIDQDTALDLLRQSINEDPAAWLGWEDAALSAVERDDYVVLQLSREQVFGQGILDVGKAVRGIGRLDANRMTAADVTALDELAAGREDALETFDTKGYTAEFSNDISERQWDDKWHHPEFQTTGSDPEKTADALALAGKSVGLRKTGAGMLILSGDNTYAGATVADGGTLAVARRADGTGGILQNSDVLVRQGGSLIGDGEIKRRLVNSGVVVPGFRGDTLTVGAYEQKDDGQLVIFFDSQREHNTLSAATATLGGDLIFMPEPGFYANDFTMALNNVLQTSNGISGQFGNFLAEDRSPTLEVSLTNYDPATFSGTVRMDRPVDAYSRYADNAGAASLGRVLPGIGGVARGDMQSLLAAVDWSAPDGSGVRRALNLLGPEAYDASARASLQQQAEFNGLLLARMLSTKAILCGTDSPDAAEWQVWATPYGTASRQENSGDVSGWDSVGVGLLAGMNRRLDSDLTAGFHVALAVRHTSVDGDHDATVDTRSALVGVQGLLTPERWGGGYLAAQARIGVEQGEMERNVSFNGYKRHNESDWMGLTGSALLGGGKDGVWKFGSGTLSAGPLGWLEYGFLHRPSLSESKGQASRLHVEDKLYDSLQLSLGAHAAWNAALENGTTLGVDLLAAWRHELLDGSFRTHAAFRDYGANGFGSDTDIAGRDALLLQSGLRLTHASGAFIQAELGGEIFRTRSTSVNAGLSLGWEF